MSMWIPEHDKLPDARKELVKLMDNFSVQLRRGKPLPYIWAGQSLETGADCSGFVIEMLDAVGILPELYDTTAAGLYDKFPRYSDYQDGLPGDLVYFASASGRISHVGMLYQAQHKGWVMMHAAGGGKSIKTKAGAYERQAWVCAQSVSARPRCRGYGRVIK